MSSVVQLKKLKSFPIIEDDNKIDIVEFLEASEDVVKIIGSFGKLFSPVVNDMQGNIEKLRKLYKKDIVKFIYLENLLVHDLNPDINFTADALLWLKRALQLICKFFTNILNDQNLNENLREHLQNAYNESLKPYHSWFVQNTVSFIYRWVPKRSELLGKGCYHDENIKVLSEFLPNMKLNLRRIDNLLIEINYDCSNNKA